MVVFGEKRPVMDVLAGATTTRVDVDERLLEGARIDDLLAEMPGVQIRRFGGVGERFEISIRGSRPEQVPVFLNGLRLDTSLTGRSDLSTLCLDVLQEIQVTRGAGAARSGSGAIGGVVNLTSRRAGAEPETRLRATAGHFDSYEGSLRHARRIGPWDLSFGYCGFHTEGDFKFQQNGFEAGGIRTGGSPILRRINNEAERHTGIAEISRALGDGRIGVTHLSSDLDRGAPGFARIETQRAEAREENYGALTSLAFEYPIEPIPQGRLDVSLAHRFERNRFRDPIPQSGAQPIKIRTEVHGFIGQASLRTEGTLLGGRQAASFLAEGRGDARTSNEARRESRRSVALRAELESGWWSDRVVLSPSLRFERYQGLEAKWLPSLAVRVEPSRWLELRGAVAESYRAPSFQELFLPDKGFESGNPDLKPEEALSFEVGAKITSPFDAPLLDLEIEATYFRSEIERSIVFQLVSPNKRSFVNLGRTRNEGYELSLRWQPHDWLRLTTSRTVTRSRLRSSGCSPAGIARSQTDGRLEIGPRHVFKVVGELHYTGRIFLDSGCGSFLESRISYDASASVDLTELPLPYARRLAESLWLSLRGRNLGNVSQYDTGAFPRPGRNLAVALEGVF